MTTQTITSTLSANVRVCGARRGRPLHPVVRLLNCTCGTQRPYSDWTCVESTRQSFTVTVVSPR